jgi:hypothetical protein
MTTLAALMLIANIAIFRPPPVAAQAQQNWCSTPARRESLRQHLRGFLKVVDSAGVSWGALLTPGKATSIRLDPVTDQAICERAARAYYRYELGPFPADGIAVVRFGDRYGVLGNIHGGEWALLRIYDLDFHTITNYGV